MNDEKIEGPHTLKHGDFIGLGCNLSLLDLVPSNEWDTYFVFQLVDKTSVMPEGEVIDLVSDDEPDLNDIKPVLVEPAEQQAPIDVASNGQDQEQDHDDNELIYSQQVLREIKQEVNCPDEMVAHDEDFSIILDSNDESDDENSWTHKLSQDQDLVVKKVTELIKNQKRKLTKQIEAIPLNPVKKARRNSVSAAPSLYTSNVSVPDKSIANAKNSTKTITAQPSTSSPLNEPENPNPNPKRFIDRLDPFAKKEKTMKKNHSFEDELKKVDVIPKKKRIAHAPKNSLQKAITSILRLKNGCWPSEGARNKCDLKVKFAAEPSIRVYQQTEHEVADVLIESPAKVSNSNHQMDRMDGFENDPLHTIITDITEWKTDWIAVKNQSPPLNGVNSIVYPLVNEYTTFESYKQYV